MWANPHTLGPAEDVVIYVWPSLVFVGMFVCTRADPISFEHYVARFPVKKPKQTSSEDRVHRSRTKMCDVLRARILDEYPWLTAEDIANVMNDIPREPGQSRSNETKAVVQPLVPILDEDAAAEAVIELRAIRDKWHWAEAELYANFHVVNRGGGSTKAKTGSASDCVACQAREWAIPWCQWIGCNEMRSFKYTAHGENVCMVLAREWCRKQSHFYQHWVDHGCLEEFDFDSIPDYTLSEEFYDTLENVSANSKTFKRMQDLARWRPHIVEDGDED